MLVTINIAFKITNALPNVYYLGPHDNDNSMVIDENTTLLLNHFIQAWV